MSKLGSLLVGAGVALVFGLLIGGSLFVLGLEEIEEAPDFTITDTDGNAFTLSDHRGSIVIIDLFAVECPDCKFLSDELVKVRTDFPEVVLVSVDIWASTETDEDIRGFIAEHNSTWPHGLDTDNVAEKFQVVRLAKLVIVDEEGIIRFVKSSSVGVGGISPSAEEIADAIRDIQADEASAVGITQLGLVGLAMIAGVATFFSPCSFPLLPGFVAFYLGRKRQEGVVESFGQRAGIPMLAMVSGFLLVFAIITLLVITLGSVIVPWVTLLQPVIGGLFILLGILIFLPFGYQFLFERLLSVTGKQRQGQFLPMFAYGLGYAGASAGCTFPVFAALFLGTLATGDTVQSLVVMSVWAGSATVLMAATVLLVAMGETVIVKHFNKVLPALKYVMGTALVLAGLYLVWFWWISS